MEKFIKIIVISLVFFSTTSYIFLAPTFNNKFVVLNHLNEKDDCSDIIESDNQFKNCVTQFNSPYFDSDYVKPIVIYKIITNNIAEYFLSVRDSKKPIYNSKDKLTLIFTDDSQLSLDVESKENPYQDRGIGNDKYNILVNISQPKYLDILKNKKIESFYLDGKKNKIDDAVAKDFIKNVNCIIYIKK